jgi:hypothetical protein
VSGPVKAEAALRIAMPPLLEAPVAERHHPALAPQLNNIELAWHNLKARLFRPPDLLRPEVLDHAIHAAVFA